MNRPETFSIASDLAAPAARIWSEVARPDGVNDELWPLVRMTFPGLPAGFSLDDAPTGRALCRCWLLAFGLVPSERHALKFERVEPGRGFVETSSSWAQRL